LAGGERKILLALLLLGGVQPPANTPPCPPLLGRSPRDLPFGTVDNPMLTRLATVILYSLNFRSPRIKVSASRSSVMYRLHSSTSAQRKVNDELMALETV